LIHALRQPYPSRHGKPILDRVNTDIFIKTYFMQCLQCTFCNDACCTYGVDVAIDEARRIEEHGDALARYTQVPRERWFDGSFAADPDFPGQGYTQTSIGPRGCIFLNPTGRSCMVHAFCLQNGMDYHDLKPMVCCLFPVTFSEGLLAPSIDVDDQSLICLNQGVSLYSGAREELRYYFGDELVAELDALQR
jgi:Fe-S-cluster containining protein